LRAICSAIGLGNNKNFTGAAVVPAACRAMKRSGASVSVIISEATMVIDCRKDSDVIDETSMADKPIDDVMNAQKDLVGIVRQVVCEGVTKVGELE